MIGGLKPLYLKKLKLINYRNYESINIDFTSQINILRGPNAQGKTNLIESIYYLAIGKAYRSARENQIIRWNNNYFGITGEIINKFGKSVLKIAYNNSDDFNKEIKINGIKTKKMADLLGNLTAVLFAPEDLNIIKGSPLERRKLLDNDISQVSPDYYVKLQRYNKILIQRNHLLKKISFCAKGYKELEVWNIQFLNICEDIIIKRLQVLEKLNPLTRLMHRKLTNGKENLEFKYLFNKNEQIKKEQSITKLLNEELKKVKEDEICRGITLMGPHRDDLIFTVNNNNLKLYGSQGQHRSAVLSIKLAELEFFKAESGEYPILLLDDVFSELDKERREKLISIIHNKYIQCFITTTEDCFSLWDDQKDISNFYVEKGTLKCN